MRPEAACIIQCLYKHTIVYKMEGEANAACAADLFLYKPEDAVSFQEFFARYKDKFPMLAVVVEGLYGPTRFDTFENLQIIRIDGYTCQPRVVATGYKKGKHKRDFTIPVNLSLKYHVLQSDKQWGNLQTMAEILTENVLPVIVKMEAGSQKSARIGQSYVPCDQLEGLILRKKYNEYYLKVNHIDTKELVMNPVVRLGSLSQDIMATPVLGFRYDTEKNYKEFLSKLDQQVAERIEDYDVMCGDLNIVEYIEDSAETCQDITQTLTERTDPRPAVPPRDKTNVTVDYSEDSIVTEDKTQTLDEMTDLPPVVPPRDHRNDPRTTEDSSEDEDNVYICMKSFPAESSRDPLIQTPASDSDEQPVEQNTAQTEMKHETERAKDQEIETVTDGVNAVTDNVGNINESVGDDFILVPVGQKPPLRIECRSYRSSENQAAGKSPEFRVSGEKTEQHRGRRNIEMYTIDDVCDTLESLNLDRYITRFKEELISGRILTMITDQDMQNELGMRRLEAVRLCAFIEFGHIPM